MAYETINDLMIGICDAIRTKEGSSEPIAAQDIPSRILALNINSKKYLFKDGKFLNQDKIVVNTYGMITQDNLLYGNVSAAGFYINVFPSNISSVKVKIQNNGNLYGIQYGTCSASASLPTIATNGTGRLSYKDVYLNSNETTELEIKGYLAINNSLANNCGIVSIWYEEE